MKAHADHAAALHVRAGGICRRTASPGKPPGAGRPIARPPYLQASSHAPARHGPPPPCGRAVQGSGTRVPQAELPNRTPTTFTPPNHRRTAPPPLSTCQVQHLQMARAAQQRAVQATQVPDVRPGGLQPAAAEWAARRGGRGRGGAARAGIRVVGFAPSAAAVGTSRGRCRPGTTAKRTMWWWWGGRSRWCGMHRHCVRAARLSPHAPAPLAPLSGTSYPPLPPPCSLPPTHHPPPRTSPPPPPPSPSLPPTATPRPRAPPPPAPNGPHPISLLPPCPPLRTIRPPLAIRPSAPPAAPPPAARPQSPGRLRSARR